MKLLARPKQLQKCQIHSHKYCSSLAFNCAMKHTYVSRDNIFMDPVYIPVIKQEME